MNKKHKNNLNNYANNLKNKYFKKFSKNPNIIFHIDVNCAFLSWKAVDLLKNEYKEDIRLIPSVICPLNNYRHGIILAKSYPAAALGIKTGETLNSALYKCPDLKVFNPDHDLFLKSSNNMMNLLQKYTYYIQQYSIDECFLDVTDFLFGKSPENLAKEIKQDIFNNLGFTVNIGIGNNKVMAKTASDFKKPDNINTLYNYEIKTKLWPLDISNLFMIGKKTQYKLRKVGINTVYDLANSNYSDIISILGKSGDTLWKNANGIDPSKVLEKKKHSKSISNSETFPKDSINKEYILNRIIYITNKVVERMQYENLSCKTISVEFRTRDFINFSKSITLPHYTNFSNEIIENVKNLSEDIYFSLLNKTKSDNFNYINKKKLNSNLLDINGNIKPIRLIRVKLSNLTERGNEEKSIFDYLNNKKKIYNEKNKNIDKTVNKLKEKYGPEIIKRARNLKSKKEDNLLM